VNSSAAVLVVDDNEDNRYTLTRRLTREGYANLTVAGNGREALEFMRSKPFDLVLLDIMMPEINGYEVLEQMKHDPVLRSLPVIMISALSEVDSVIRCVELGAEDYLTKPFDPVLLRARVNASLEKKRLRDEIKASLARLESEMSAARQLQLDMLPRSFPQRTADRPVEVCASMQPAREVGGDLYDCFWVAADTFCFLVGDVSGKGAAAAMFMARTRSLVRLAVELWKHSTEPFTPARVAEAVNNELRQNNDARMFVTVLLGLLDARTGLITYINAGHPPPYRLNRDGVERYDDRVDAPLGVRSKATYQNRTLVLQPGDALFVVSDGVLEASDTAGELFGAGRLVSALNELRTLHPDAVVGGVTKAVHGFTGLAPQADDITALALRWLPTA
jgi:sigma-B regulation protein RsbU (phosphoserine phosphatase)